MGLPCYKKKLLALRSVRCRVFGSSIGLWSRLSAALCARSCLALRDPMDCSPSGSSDHGILQARILEWVAISASRASSPPRWILYHCTTWESSTPPVLMTENVSKHWSFLLLVVKLFKSGGSSCFLSSQKASRYSLQYILSFPGNLSDVYIIISPGRRK